MSQPITDEAYTPGENCCYTCCDKELNELSKWSIISSRVDICLQISSEGENENVEILRVSILFSEWLEVNMVCNAVN